MWYVREAISKLYSDFSLSLESHDMLFLVSLQITAFPHGYFENMLEITCPHS
jgi:hypothetical protein